MLFGRDAVTAQVMSSIEDMLGKTGAGTVEAMLAGASRPAAGILATVLGSGALCRHRRCRTVEGCTQRSLGSRKIQGVWAMAFRPQLRAFAAVLTLGFLLLVSLLVSAGLAAAGKYASIYLPEGLLHVSSALISFLVVMALFAMMFKWLPDISVGWRNVWLGALFTALFFEIGKAAIGFYIGKQGLESTYGAAASIVVVLIWVYYTSQIILMGAEITHSYAQQNGSLKRNS
jgi:membrane protein